MTTAQTIRNLKGAVSDAEDTINDLVSQAEDLEIENQRLTTRLDSVIDERDGLLADLSNCQEQVAGG